MNTDKELEMTHEEFFKLVAEILYKNDISFATAKEGLDHYYCETVKYYNGFKKVTLPKAPMDSKRYIQNALKTDLDADGYTAIANKLNGQDLRTLHAAIGLCTESGELLDALKKSLYYEKELDTVNLIEEMGDIFWYMAILCDVLETDFESIMTKNIEKLKARYGDCFTSEKAINRDLSKEREILEQNN